MEHRHSKRRPVAMDTVIAYSGLGLVRGRIRDINSTGMFIETGPVILPLDATLGLSLTVYDGDAPVHGNPQASVVHVRRDGVGVHCHGLPRRLRDLILGATPR